MGFLRRRCWHCAGSESAHRIVAATKKSDVECNIFLICPFCQMPSCALLQSINSENMPCDTLVDDDGDIRDSTWTVVRVWPERRIEEQGTLGLKRHDIGVITSAEVQEPAEGAYKRALEIAKHVRLSNMSQQQRRMPGKEFSSVPSRELDTSIVRGKLTLREFSERLIKPDPA